MALRFNPPPNWPAPPEGFNPPAGWQPDPAWGPAPEGWQLWVEDSVPGMGVGSAPQTASGADAGWAPTQAVPTSSSPVADPTGQSASAPSGDYAASAPMGSSAPMGTSAPMGASAPFGGSAPMAGSAPGASPYAAAMDYAQSPTPYQSQGAPGGGGMPPSSWQPVDVGAPGAGGGSKSIVKQWWFWTIIVVLVLALVIGVVVALSGGDDDGDNATTSSSAGGTTQTKAPDEETKTPEEEETEVPEPTQASTGGDDQGFTRDNPADPTQHSLHMTAGDYSTDPSAYIDVQFEAVKWNANEELKNAYASSGYPTGYEEPPAGKVYIRVPVTVTYHGQGQFSDWDIDIDYVDSEGNTVAAEYTFLVDDEFSAQDMPRDGGSAKGNFTFLIDEADVNTGVFAVTAFYNPTEMYMAAK